MKISKYIASECGAKLDSNVYSGGGTDDTEVLQSILDKAKDQTQGVYLVVDGAALIRGLKVYSNTTIECLSKECGFYLCDHSDCSVLENGNQIRMDKIIDKNIQIIGGTYNQNCTNQQHSFNYEDDTGIADTSWLPGFKKSCDPVVNMLFVGVENLIIRDLSIRDQRTYAALFKNWSQVTIENVVVELPNKMHGQNQDGFHFFGPGRFLNMRNVSGCTSDDFIALAPDEADGVSSITDVLIDGVILDDADQAIRMLCHHKGFLDRITVRNITGTYRSYGFFINPFFNSGTDQNAGYGNILIENVNLRSTAIDYDYTEPFLFRVGGRVRSLTLKDIQHYHPIDKRYLVDIGLQYYMDDAPLATPTQIDSLVVDGLHVQETSPLSCDTTFIRLKRADIKNLTVRNVEIERDGEVGKGGRFIAVTDSSNAGTITLRNISAQNVAEFLVKDEDATVEHFIADGINFK